MCFLVPAILFYSYLVNKLKRYQLLYFFATFYGLIGLIFKDYSQNDGLQELLKKESEVAFKKPWHRLERGLRLNRLRIFIEDISDQFNMTKDEKDSFFIFLQKALDKKLLNTLKVVNYDQDTQKITQIRGLEIKRNDNVLKWGFSIKKQKSDCTRKKKRNEDIVSIDATITSQTKIEEIKN